MSDDHARIDHVANVIMRTDFGPSAIVNRTATVISIYEDTPASAGQWRATFGIQADRLPVDIRGPRFAFDVTGEYRPGKDAQPPAKPPTALVASAELVRERLHALREDGHFMTPAEVKEMVSTFGDLIAAMRVEGIQDEAGHASKAAALMASHNPDLPAEIEPGLRPY